MFDKILGKHNWYSQSLKKKYQQHSWIVYGLIALTVILFFTLPAAIKILCFAVLIVGAWQVLVCSGFKNQDAHQRESVIAKKAAQQKQV